MGWASSECILTLGGAYSGICVATFLTVQNVSRPDVCLGYLLALICVTDPDEAQSALVRL